MPQDPAVALAALLRTSTIDDHEDILKAANAAIKANKGDTLAQHTRVVTLLKLDRFDDAYRAISEGGVKLESSCALEKAYALYKLGRLEDATKGLASVGIQSRSFSHVAAQVAYRAENFDEAQNIYNRLVAADSDGEINDLTINMKAVQAQAELKGVSLSYEPESEKAPETFELCYNSACAHIGRGSLEMASKLLQRALTLCDASDELTEEDKEEERKPILAQQAFVAAKMGDCDHAREVYSSMITEACVNPSSPNNVHDDEIICRALTNVVGSYSESDPDLKVVAQNNQWALEKQPHNPFLVERQVASWISPGTRAKLFKFQSNVLARNASIVDLHAHKVQGVKERAYKTMEQLRLPSTNPNVITLSTIGAAAETQGVAENDVLRSLLCLLKKRPLDTGLALTVMQLHLQRKNVGAALHVLESFFSHLEKSDDEQCQYVRFSPGLIALAVALKKIQKRDTSAKAELVKASDFWCKRPASSVTSLLKEAGIELASSSSKHDLVLAGNTFEKLLSEQYTSPMTSAGLVAAFAATSSSAVEKYIAELPSVDDLIDGVDVNSLISTGAVLTAGGSSVSKKRSSPTESTGDRTTNKRRRRRLPKNLVEGQTPDPERWLPLRDRSSYRPKGKKGRKKAAESTQGGMVKEEETLGLVGGGGVKVEKASASNSSKKKKKGKK